MLYHLRAAYATLMQALYVPYVLYLVFWRYRTVNHAPRHAR